MNYDVSKDGYATIENQFGVTFGFADPEFWMYHGLPESVAYFIAKGYPDYWYSSMGGKQCRFTRRNAELLAYYQRLDVLPELAEVSMPVRPFISLLKHFSYGYAVIGSPSHKRWLRDHPPPHDAAVAIESMFRTNNPFELLYLYFAYDNPPIDPTSLKSWTRMAANLLPELLEAASAQKQLREDAIQSRFRLRDRLPDGAIYQRGSRLSLQGPLEKLFAPEVDGPVRWGPLSYNTESVTRSHFCVSGMTRSGKTTLLRLLFQSLFSLEDLDTRFVVYDSKPELLPYLFSPQYLEASAANDLESQFYLLNPFDRRCTPWHIAADADSPENARRIAEVLFPDASNTPDYFPKAARRVATAVMTSLRRKAGTQWTFYDLVAALQPENTMAVLAEHPPSQQLYQQFLTGPHASAGDLAKTLSAMTGLTLPAAWSWHNSTRPRLSLRDWVKSQSKTIVIADSHAYPESSHEINRLLLDLLSRYLLAAGQDTPSRTFFYLDEFEHLGHIPVLPKMAKQGASLNVNLALCIHDLDMLKQVYPGAAEGLLGQCSYFAFLAVKSRPTANWASGVIGSQEVQVEQLSYKQSAPGQSPTSPDAMVSVQLLSRPVVLPDQLMNLPLAGPENGLTAYFLTPHHGPYLGNLPVASVLPPKDGKAGTDQAYRLWPAAPGIKAYEPQAIESLDPPDDSFSTLADLGFQRTHATPGTASDQSSSGSLLDIDFEFDFGDE